MGRYRIKLWMSGSPIADFLPTREAAEKKAIELDYAWRDENGDFVLDPGVVIEEVWVGR